MERPVPFLSRFPGRSHFPLPNQSNLPKEAIPLVGLNGSEKSDSQFDTSLPRIIISSDMQSAVAVFVVIMVPLVALGVSLGGGYLIASTLVHKLWKPAGKTTRIVAFSGAFTAGFILIISIIGWIILSNLSFGR
jgi:hypothetical protein